MAQSSAIRPHLRLCVPRSSAFHSLSHSKISLSFWEKKKWNIVENVSVGSPFSRFKTSLLSHAGIGTYNYNPTHLSRPNKKSDFSTFPSSLPSSSLSILTCTAASTVAGPPSSILDDTKRTKKQVFNVEGGGKLIALVTFDDESDCFQVSLSLDLEKRGEDFPCMIHWGLSRSDRTAWYMLEEDEVPSGTLFVKDDNIEAMRTPFLSFEDGKRSLTLSLPSDLSPCVLTFALVQSPGEGGRQQWRRTSSLSNFIIPLGMEKGSPLPLGATRLNSRKNHSAAAVEESTLNFALFSENAEGVKLCLYEKDEALPSLEIDLDPCYFKTGSTWHVALPGVEKFEKYGFRVRGDDLSWEKGSRFLPRNVLLDPYAKLIANFTPGQESDYSPAAALGLLPPPVTAAQQREEAWESDVPLNIPQEELICYRTSVSSFTASDDSQVLPTELRGTFAGFAQKLDHLTDLGINAVIFEPIAAYDETQGPYFPINFFAPMPTLSPPLALPLVSSTAEDLDTSGVLAGERVKDMVKALHHKGIEVLLEVVFSHTAEKSDLSPKTISFRGIDNVQYYCTDEEGNQVVLSDLGFSNSINLDNVVVQQLILDSLCHWVTEYHVDGFVFLNAPSFLNSRKGGKMFRSAFGEGGEVAGGYDSDGYGSDGSNPPWNFPNIRPPLIEAIAKHPLLANSKIVFDSSSSATGKFVPSRFPHYSSFSELNHLFKHDVLSFLIGHKIGISAVATRLTGSGDLFANGRFPSFSFNSLSLSFGLTLADAVSYNVDYEPSWNCGVNGASEEPLILNTRMSITKTALFALFLSQGVPVLTMGDEYGHTKAGSTSNTNGEENFNFLWSDAHSQYGKSLSRFISSLVVMRRRRRALLQRKYFFFIPGDLSWHGQNVFQPEWDNPNCSFIAASIHSEGIEGSLSPDVSSSLEAPALGDLYFAFNANSFSVTCQLPSPPPTMKWFRVVDTSLPFGDDVIVFFENDRSGRHSLLDRRLLISESSYTVEPFSGILLEARRVIEGDGSERAGGTSSASIVGAIPSAGF